MCAYIEREIDKEIESYKNTKKLVISHKPHLNEEYQVKIERLSIMVNVVHVKR